MQASQVALLLKNPPTSAGDIRDAVLISRLGRSPGGGKDNSLQHSCLKNPLVGYSPWGCKESDTTEVTQHSTWCMYVYACVCVCVNKKSSVRTDNYAAEVASWEEEGL